MINSPEISIGKNYEYFIREKTEVKNKELTKYFLD